MESALKRNGKGCKVWMHNFDFEYRDTLKSPWYSGLAQGQGLSVLIRAYQETRNIKYKDAANRTKASFCITYDVIIKEVLIYKFVEGVFYSKLICEKDGTISEIDSRTSDAIAVGVRFNSPIFTLSNVLEEAGITSDQEDAFESDSIYEEEEDVFKEEQELNSLVNDSIQDLEKQLQEALENENYELASKLRDEIKKRS